MARHTLYLVTYTRGTYDLTGRTKPYHWSFFISTDGVKSIGIAHQLHGMPGAFYYQGPEHIDINQPDRPKEKLEIGEVEDVQLWRLYDILKALRIDSVESSGWNCQDWALAGLKSLREEGFIYEHMTNAAIKSWLKET